MPGTGQGFTCSLLKQKQTISTQKQKTKAARIVCNSSNSPNSQHFFPLRFSRCVNPKCNIEPPSIPLCSLYPCLPALAVLRSIS